MGFLGGPLPGYETEIGIDPGNPDWVAPFTGPVISNPFAQSSEPSIGTQVGDIAGDYLSKYSNPIKSGSTGSGSMLDNDEEGGIEKITDGLYLYNPGKFVQNYAAGMQGGGGSKSSGLLDTVGKGVGIAAAFKTAFPLTFASICDIRTKTDVSPLETTDVNDDLAEVAFFVKGLRECA